MKDMLQKSVALPQASLWRNRDFMLAGSARFIAAVGYGAVVVSIMLHLQSTLAGPAAVWTVAAYLLLATLPTVLIAPWAGRLVDTRDSRTLAVKSSLLSAAAVAAMALSIVLLTDYMPALFALTVVLEAALAVSTPTWTALLPRIVGEESTPRALGTMQAMLMLAQLAGPAVGGILVGAGGIATSFWAAAACYVLLALGARLIRTRRAPSTRHDGSPARLLDGLRALNSDKILWVVLLGTMFVVLAAEAINVLEVFLARVSLGASPAEFGFLSAAMGAGLVGGSLAAGRIRSEKLRLNLYVVSIAGTGAGLFLMGTAPTIAWLYVYCAAAGAWVGVLNATFGALLLMRAPEEQRGQVSAMANGLTRAVSIAALGVGGVLGSAFDPRLGFAVCGAATLVVAAGTAVAMARVSLPGRSQGPHARSGPLAAVAPGPTTGD